MSNAKNLVGNEKHRCGYIAIIGRPNVGKSSLLNKIIGHPISITSKKRQTTRDRILGVFSKKNAQFVFVDTPGIESTGRFERNRKLNSLAISIFDDVDLILWVLEAGKINNEDKLISSLLPKSRHVIIALNKIDLVNREKEKKIMYEQVEFFSSLKPKAIIPISVTKSFQINEMLSEIQSYLPTQDMIFDQNFITDKGIVFRSSEIIREKVIRLVGAELPYAVSVVIDRCLTKNNTVEIDASIIVTKKSHKPIVIGKNASRIKQITLDSSRPLKRLFDKTVFLEIWVKVR